MNLRNLDPARVAVYGNIIAVFVALFSFFQVLIMKSQLTESRGQTRVAERPWVRFRYQGEENGDGPRMVSPSPFQPIVFPTEFMNVGATPALDTKAVIALEVIPIDKEPELRSDLSRPVEGAPYFIKTNPVTKFVSGVIYPNQPAKFKSERFQYVDSSVIPLDADLEEAMNLRDHNSYVVIWGKVWYKDVFGTEHWTQFCNATAWGELEVKDDFRYPKCAHFNNADTNDGSK